MAMGHRMLLSFRFLFVFVLLFSCAGTLAKRFVPKASLQLSQQIETHSQYKEIFIKYIFDLNGDTLKLPTGVKLYFKKNGLIKNGHVVFDNNSLKRLIKRQKAFSGCSFSGLLNNETLYISSFGVAADGKQDDAPVINDVLSVIDGRNCHVIFDCEGDYGISSPEHRNTVMVGSNTTITFKGMGFLKLLSTSKLGAVLSLKKNAHDVVINNVQIDGGGEKVIVGNSGLNGVGAGNFRNFSINGGLIRNCHKGMDVTVEGKFLPGDGGKGIQVESANAQNGVFKDIYIENCHAAISCHRNFNEKGGINVTFDHIIGENCEQFSIIHQTNGEDITGDEQNVNITNFLARNCGNVDGVFIFSRTRFLHIQNGTVEGEIITPAIFRGRIGKSEVKNVLISQPCVSVINLNPSTYGNDQRKSFDNLFDLVVEGCFDYLVTSDTQKKFPYRAMTNSSVSFRCQNNPQRSILGNEVNSGGTLNLIISLPEGRRFEGSATDFDMKYHGDYRQLKVLH